jgi:hypothetical protein
MDVKSERVLKLVMKGILRVRREVQTESKES